MRVRVLYLLVVTGILLFTIVSVAPVSAPVPIEELAYDDGTYENAVFYIFAGEQVAVRFSLPAGWTTAKILQAKYYLWAGVDDLVAPFRVHIYDSDLTTDLTTPFIATPTTNDTWFVVDLTGLDIIVSNDFYIGIQWLTHGSPWLMVDEDPPIDLRSYALIIPNYPNWVLVEGGDAMIRAVVEQVLVPSAPEFNLSIPVVTSVVAAIYIALRKRIGKNIE